MARRKTKYTMRSDGRIVKTKVYPDGTKKFFYGKSDAEVEAKEAAFDAEYEKAQLPQIRSFASVADEWWGLKREKISPNSINQYKVAYTRLVEEFGDMPVTDITPQEIYSYLNRFAVRGYSTKVISNTRSVFKGIFDFAFIAGDISVNPCLTVPPVKGKPKQKRAIAAPDDLAAIEAHKYDSLIARMYYFILYTGLRRGEAVALQYKHIDRVNKVVRVEQSCAWDNAQPVLKSPKTEAGKRTVDLLDNALDVLPKCSDPNQFVFFPDGLPTRATIEGALEKYRADTGITATPHQLRHAFAALGHSAGVDAKDMQAELGHSTITMTLDIYTEIEAAHRDKVRKKLNNYVKKEKLSKKLSKSKKA